MNRVWIAIMGAALVSGCGLLPDAYSGCNKPKPYQSAGEAPPLRAPPGMDAPETRHALRIPAVPAPERPRDAGGCLDHPPAYGGARPAAG